MIINNKLHILKPNYLSKFPRGIHFFSISCKFLGDKNSYLFLSKCKESRSHKVNIIKPKEPNFSGMSKHFVPLFKEWHNSIYTFKKETIKILSYYDKLVFNLVKNYLNFYDSSIEKTYRSMRARKRQVRYSIDKMLVGRPNFKHTNDKVTIIIYYYNRRLKFFQNKINKSDSIENTINKEKYKLYIKNIKNKLSNINILVKKLYRKNSYRLSLNRQVSMEAFRLFYLEKISRKMVNKFMQREVTSIYLRQMRFIQKSKINKFYLLPLVKLCELIYRKKVVFNFINIKYIYNSASILSEIILFKLKRKFNHPFKVIYKSVNMFALPIVNRLALFDDMFNKKMEQQNKKLNKSSLSNVNLLKWDVLTQFIVGEKGEWKKWNFMHEKNTNNINKVVKNLKNKLSSGIRLEVAGRLTRRNIAQRAVRKIRYIGNIRNTNSSDRGLSTTLLRGFAQSNVTYKQCNSKRRIGSFGVKAWVSSINY